MLRVIRQLWVFSRFISEIQSSPAAPGYRQSRHKRKNSRTRWLPPADRTPEKEKPATQTRVLLRADLERSSVFMDSSIRDVRLHARKVARLDRTSRRLRDPSDDTRRYFWGTKLAQRKE